MADYLHTALAREPYEAERIAKAMASLLPPGEQVSDGALVPSAGDLGTVGPKHMKPAA